MKNYKIITTIFISIFVLGFIQAQDELEQEEVKVIKNFEAQLLESERLKVMASLPAVDTLNRTVNYDVPSKVLDLEYGPPQIKPIAMRRAELSEIYSTYLKAGMGNINGYYGEASHYRQVNSNLNLGGFAKYHRADNKQIENQRFADTDVNFKGQYILSPNSHVNADLGFRDEVRYFYGYNNEFNEFSKEDVRQRFQTISGEASYVNSTNENLGIDLEGNLGYSRKSDYFDNRENSYDVAVSAKKIIQTKHVIKLGLISDLNNFQDTLLQKLNNFTVRPEFIFHADKFSVQAGANLAFSKDNFDVLPFIHAAANIVSSQLVAFAGWNSNLQANTFHSLTDYNPFLVSQPEIFNSKFHDFYGGLKGKIKGVNYVGRVGYKEIDNLPLFLANSVDSLQFDVIVDTASLVYVEGVLDFTLFKKLTFISTVSQKIYSVENEEKAWHLPSFELNLTARYKMLEDKLFLKGEFFSANGVPFLNREQEVAHLNTLLELNIGAEYWINPNVGLFLDGNNLLNNKRQRWDGYANFGINFLGGVVAKF